jgi:hypothetical protein
LRQSRVRLSGSVPAAAESAATTAAAAAAAATESATTTASTETAPAAGALFTRTRFIHSQSPTIEVGAVELLNRLVRIICAHFHEAKALGATGIAIRNNVN